MSIERRNFPQFFITAPAPCPYLPGRIERKVFTHLIGSDARQLNSQLSQSGFRRSQNIAYRPTCDGCSSCVSVRVCVSEFEWTPAFRKIVRRNRDLGSEVVHAKATSEQYSLFRAYIDDRHAEVVGRELRIHLCARGTNRGCYCAAGESGSGKVRE